MALRFAWRDAANFAIVFAMGAPVVSTGTMIATRKAFGEAIALAGEKYKNLYQIG